MANKITKEVKILPATVREEEYQAMVGEATLWDKHTEVSMFPAFQIANDPNLTSSERLILMYMLSVPSGFVVNKACIKKLLANQPGELASKDTVTKWMTSLEKKGYIKHVISRDSYCKWYYVISLKLPKIEEDSPKDGGSPNKPPLNKLLINNLSPNSEPEPMASGESDYPADGFSSFSPPAPQVPTRISCAQARARHIAQKLANMHGVVQECPYAPKLDQRKILGWRRSLNRSLFPEKHAEKHANSYEAKTDPQPITPPEKTKLGKRYSKPYKNPEKVDYMAGQCTARKAMNWISFTPVGKEMHALLMEISNQERITPELARMLLRRWRTGEITLEHAREINYFLKIKGREDLNLRYVLLNSRKIREKFTNEKQVERVDLCWKWRRHTDGAKYFNLRKALGVTAAYLEDHEAKGELTFENVIEYRGWASKPLYTIISILNATGYSHLTKQYFATRTTHELEEEMAENKHVAVYMSKMAKDYPEFHFYDEAAFVKVKADLRLSMATKLKALGVDITRADQVMRYAGQIG